MVLVTLREGWVLLGEMTGQTELLVSDADLLNAIQLIDCLLHPHPQATIQPQQASLLNASDRDRVLASIYAETYGEQIQATLTCRQCDEPFDLAFRLSALVDSIYNERSLCRLVTESGIVLRLITGEDELAVLMQTPENAQAELLRRCIIDDTIDIDALNPRTLREIEHILETAAPLLSTTLSATCPECGHTQSIRFDMQSYLLKHMQAQQNQVLSEVHTLALAYRSSIDEVLALPRKQRQQFIKLLDAQASRSSRQSIGTRRRMGL